MGAEERFLSNQRLFNVTVNCVRDAVRVVTEVKDKLVRQLARTSGDKYSALEEAGRIDSDKQRRVAWGQFESWCDERGRQPMPARPEAVATYLVVLAQAGRANSTIGRHLARSAGSTACTGMCRPTACLGHPLNAAAWLVSTLAARGEPLQAGDIVLTGAIGPMVGLAPGNHVCAKVGGLGAVSFIYGKAG